MTATRRTRVVFAAHAFPRHQGDLTGGFLLRLAEALEREGVDVQAVAPAAPGLPARDRLRGVAVRRYRYAPRRAETLAYTGGMHLRAASPTGALALAGLLAAGALALRRVAAGADLVHAHWWFPGGVQALAAGKRPLVTTLHGTDVRLARTRPAARAACARVLRASAAITTVSTASASLPCLWTRRCSPQATSPGPSCCSSVAWTARRERRSRCARSPAFAGPPPNCRCGWWGAGRSSRTCTGSPRNWGSPTACAGRAASPSPSWPPATAAPPPCWCPAATKASAWLPSRASSPARP